MALAPLRTYALSIATPFHTQALYNGYVYGLLYLYFEAYPLVFQGRHGFNAGELGLAYIPIIIGTVLAFAAHAWQDRFYRHRKAQNGGQPVPEARLAWAFVGGPAFAAGLFWFAFTTYGSVSYWAPLLAGIPFGFGILIIYVSHRQNSRQTARPAQS